MNSPKNFLVIIGIFFIFGHFPDGAAGQPYNKKGSLFNYDDELDYFQVNGREKPDQKDDDFDTGKYLQQMPSKPVLSEDDAELALMSDMSIYTDDDVAWEHEHGRSGIFRGIPKVPKLRSLQAAKKQQPQSQSHQSQSQSPSHSHQHPRQQAPARAPPLPIYPPYPHKESKPYAPKNLLDPTDMSIGKWNWMEKILRQQAERV